MPETTFTGPDLTTFLSPAPGLRAGGVEAHAAGGAPAALRLHPLPPGVEAGHLSPDPAAGAADPLGRGVGSA